MANTLLTNQIITRIALRLAKNTNSLIRNIDTQYSDEFAQSGAKVGNSIRIRKQVDYTLRSGPTVAIQNTTDQFTTLAVNNYIGVDMGFSSVDRALSVDDFTRRYVRPAVNVLVGGMALAVMQVVENGGSATPAAGAQHFVHNVDANNNTIVPTAATWLQAGAVLTANEAPMDGRMVMLDPLTNARTVAGLAGYFNPQARISEQTESGLMQKQLLGFDWYNDQTTLKHQTGTLSAATVSTAGQTGNTIVTSAITGTLLQGDIITIAGVNSVNTTTKQSNLVPRMFVVTAPVPSGATVIPIYPALTPALLAAGPGGTFQQQYQTVDVSPAAGAAITLVNKSGEIFRKNLAFVKDAMTLATVDLPLPTGGVISAARESQDGISMRMITYYNGDTDQWNTRLDLLFGVAMLRPEWIVAVGDQI